MKEGPAGSRALRGALSSGDQQSLHFAWPCFSGLTGRGADNSVLATTQFAVASLCLALLSGSLRDPAWGW